MNGSIPQHHDDCKILKPLLIFTTSGSARFRHVCYEEEGREEKHSKEELLWPKVSSEDPSLMAALVGVGFNIFDQSSLLAGIDGGKAIGNSLILRC